MLPVGPLEAPVAPVAALRRIAYLLERSQAGEFRIKAFRTAVAAVEAMPAAQLAERAAAGTLTDLPGVGETTATVIGQALAGVLPDYLADLQQRTTHPLAAGGELTYAALVGDLHCHTDASDGTAPLAEMARAAIELGQQWSAITDHSPRLRVAHGLSTQRLREQIGQVRALDAQIEPGFQLFTGIEVDILLDGSLDVDPQLLPDLDVVTASAHWQLAMPAEQMTPRLLAAVAHPRVAVLGHVTGRLVAGPRGRRAQSAFDASAVFQACAATGTAVEINSRPERRDPPDELIRLADSFGCLFAVDSDAHAPGHLDMKAYGAERAEALGIPLARIVTTWPAEQVRAWARQPAQWAR